VLELGAGTGRITIPIAEDGLSIYALDSDEGMRKALQLKVDMLPEDVGEEKLGFIDHSGQFVIPPIFNTDVDFGRNSTDFSEDWASVSENLRPTITEMEKFVYID
jgi:hypothetical protein